MHGLVDALVPRSRMTGTATLIRSLGMQIQANRLCDKTFKHRSTLILGGGSAGLQGPLPLLTTFSCSEIPPTFMGPGTARATFVAMIR